MSGLLSVTSTPTYRYVRPYGWRTPLASPAYARTRGRAGVALRYPYATPRGVPLATRLGTPSPTPTRARYVPPVCECKAPYSER